MITIQTSVSKAWLNKEKGFRFDEKYYLDPFFRKKQEDEINLFVKSRFPDIAMYYMEDDLMQAPFIKPNQILLGGIQPNMFLALALGAKFRFFPDKDSDIEGDLLKGIQSKNELPDLSKILSHPFIKKVEDQIREIKTKHPELVVIPPFFWDTSGRATIHGIITTSFRFIGDEAMMMLLMNPGLMHEIHSWITDTYIKLIKYFASLGGMKITSLHVGECSGTMLESESYKEFVVPYLSKLGTELAPVRLHSCGMTDHLIDTIAGIKNIYAITTGSGTSVKKIREKMGKEFRINIFPPVSLLQKGVGREKISQWLDQAVLDNADGNLSISYHLEPDYDFDNCMFVHEYLKEKGLIRGGRLY
jgi:uroporphyrinogen-III decarboxylase